MRRHTNSEVRAEVTVNYNGAIYIGVEVTEPLDLQYNDRVRVTVPRENAPDATYTGCLNKSDSIATGGKKTFRELHPGGSVGASFQVEAIVEPASRTWDEANDLTDRRSDGYYTLKAKL